MLLQPQFRLGQRVRVLPPASPDPYTMAHHGQVGTVRSRRPVMVPAGVAQGLPAPPGWVWFAYVVVMDDGTIFSGIAEQELREP